MNNDNNKYEYEKKLIKNAIREYQLEEEQSEKENKLINIKILLINLSPIILLLISLIIGGLLTSFK